MALSLTPNYAEAHCNLGAVYKGMGQVEKSVKSFRNAVGGGAKTRRVSQ